MRSIFRRLVPLSACLCLARVLVAAEFSVASFEADVTVPVGHGMMGGAWQAKSVADPLLARGFVILGAQKPIVFVSVDWCEIRNEAYDRWRAALAEAAGTEPSRVLVTTIHQHEAPVADLEAERILRGRNLAGSVCDLEFHEKAVRRVAEALRAALPKARRFTHLGTGQAKVERVASNRRYLLPDGKPSFDRGSATRNVLAREAGEGVIDPWLKTLSFWNGDTPLVAVSGYAIHPMSYYRTGEVSADFPGLARARRQRELPDVFQIYFSGCSGNVTAGKYNDGARTNRVVLADRLHAAMAAAWRETRRQPVGEIAFRHVPLKLKVRENGDFDPAEMEKKLLPGIAPFQQCLAAMGLSWRKRSAAGRPIEVPLIDFGAAQFLLLPGEVYVEYQLAAQKLRPDSFLLVAGYGDGATGYIPTEQHWAERDGNLSDWCWVAPGAEQAMMDALRRLLLPQR